MSSWVLFKYESYLISEFPELAGQTKSEILANLQVD